MAEKTSKSGRPLVIVESPAKARTIGKFLGPRFTIEASIGHVRDLPEGAKQIPAEFKGTDWAHLGVNVHDEFRPIYVIPPGKLEQVRKLKNLLKTATELYLATDEDREGEAISWHLKELLRPKVPVRRLVFHEITKEAIQDALKQPREIDDALVRAQETRRILDRLFGYEVSPLLWRKVRPKLSAGRVQSVAVRMIVNRERARVAFVPATYWDLLGNFATRKDEQFQATLTSQDGHRLPTSKDFDPQTGRIKDSSLALLNAVEVEQLAAKLKSAEFRVASVEEKPYTSRPSPPFTTSTLQQEANRKLGFTARRTMQAAQSLYENGHITYMRTDSTTLASVAIDAARDLVATQYGQQYLPSAPRIYRTKVKNAQEAHEAIRPAGHPFEFPEALRGKLNGDEFRLYELIWKRTVASQMEDSRGRRTSVVIEALDSTFQVSGKTIDFPGYLRAYVEGSDDPDAELAEREVVLPDLRPGDIVNCHALEPKEHTTQPPARFNEATLTKALEEMGIGRPSTYASIIDTILARDYVFKRGNALVPTWTAFAVCQLLEEHLPSLVDFNFTAKLEDDLDAISRGEAEYLAYLKNFYYGNGQPGLKPQLTNIADVIDARFVSRISLGKPSTGEPEEIFVRVGRFGPFLEQGTRRASLTTDVAPDELTADKAIELLDKAAQQDVPLGYCPETNKPVFLKVGRYGPYVQLGMAEGDERPKNASLLKGMKPDDVTVEVALKLLSFPRKLGEYAGEQQELQGQEIQVLNGRFGPYVKCGNETRSISSGISPLEITREEAVQLLSQPRAQRRGFAAREPLRVLGESPVTNSPVKILEGRYGLYLSDGVSNASLQKDQRVEDVTLEGALAMLAERAAAGPKKPGGRRGRRGAPAPKRAAKARAEKPKAPVKKKETQKPTAAKKSAAKESAGKKAPPKKAGSSTGRPKKAAKSKE